jgi:hypothetical protein
VRIESDAQKTSTVAEETAYLLYEGGLVGKMMDCIDTENSIERLRGEG